MQDFNLRKMNLNKTLCIRTTEMHSGGEPLRIVEEGYPDIIGENILDKRRYAKENLDHLRKFLMFEPRGHYDMYGALIVRYDLADADLAVLFIHNEGYSTMCGHAVMCLGRYAVDRGLVKNRTTNERSEIAVNIQCPCGLVRAFVGYNSETKESGRVRFHSVPAFAFATNIDIEVPNYGKVTLDVGYGGTFYALVPAQRFGLDVRKSRTTALVEVATAVSEAVRAQVKLHHPESADFEFLYGTILTDGEDGFSDQPTANTCVFADREVDRAPTGSGVTARIAVQYAKGLIGQNQSRVFESGANGSTYTGMVVKETKCGDFKAVVVEVGGNGFYSGKAEFTVEENDELKTGFLLR